MNLSRRHLFGLALGAGAVAALPAAVLDAGLVLVGTDRGSGSDLSVVIRMDVSAFSAAMDDLIARLERLPPRDPAGQAAVDRLNRGDVAISESHGATIFLKPGPAVFDTIGMLRVHRRAA